MKGLNLVPPFNYEKRISVQFYIHYIYDIHLTYKNFGTICLKYSSNLLHTVNLRAGMSCVLSPVFDENHRCESRWWGWGTLSVGAQMTQPNLCTETRMTARAILGRKIVQDTVPPGLKCLPLWNRCRSFAWLRQFVEYYGIYDRWYIVKIYTCSINHVCWSTVPIWQGPKR